jgi:hypothetical protein
MFNLKHLLKAFACFFLVILAQQVTQAQPKDAVYKYIFADTRNSIFVPSVIDMHKTDLISFVVDHNDDSWKSFGFSVNYNEVTCSTGGATSM